MAADMGWAVHRLDGPVTVDGDPISGTALRARLAAAEDSKDGGAWLGARVPAGVAALLAVRPNLGARLRALSLPEHS
jgi:hypothetical protein